MNNQLNNEAPKLYKYYFAPVHEKLFIQAMEIADFAYKHERLDDNDYHNTYRFCQLVTFSEDESDLMATFYDVAKNLLPPNGKYFNDGMNAKLELERKLASEGYIFSHYIKKPKEFVSKYSEIRWLISSRNYSVAVNKYYEYLGGQFCGELHHELLYLKRLGNIHLSSRDIMFFRPPSDRSPLIQSNISEYCSYIDKVIDDYKAKDLQLPLDLLKKTTFTIPELNIPITIVFLRDDAIEQQEVSKVDWLYSRFMRNGSLFDKYIDQVKSCNILEEKKYNPRYFRLWTTYSSQMFQTEVLDKGYYLVNIDIHKHKNWRGGKREPDFTTFTSLNEIFQDRIGASDIEFTGRSHRIEHKIFYEINLLRDNRKRQIIGNEFLDAIDDILREAENILREKHGLPKIGEGWFSEMTLFRLIESIFPDAQHHISPSWLTPQHLDIFVPSKNLAFEYQGKQHYEAIDFFGGEASFEKIKQLDALKIHKCKSNAVILIHWRYDELITKESLDIKLNFIKYHE
jgi:hypothetical protein